MRCTCCGRAINPANAIRKTHGMKFDGLTPFVAVGMYGPVCAIRLGLVSKAPTRSRKPSRFAIFSKINPVRVEDGQIDIFGALSA